MGAVAVAAALAAAVPVASAAGWGRHGSSRAHQRTTAAPGASATTTATTDAEATTATPTTSGGTSSSATTGSTTATTDAAATTSRSSVVVNLFEWNWDSVATECTEVLGPDGYAAVQVAPPQDSLKKSDGSHPWWEVYQPADYGLTSRMGDEAQFTAMVEACRAAGVDVYVDAVINHMAGSGGTSYGGVTFAEYAYAGLYSYDDFHHQGTDCSTSDGAIADYEDVDQVQNCELVHLEDLRTGSSTVRAELTGYLNSLLDLGVAGFRVDAAMHVPHDDLEAVFAGLHDTVDGTEPYIALEVSGGPGVLAQSNFTDLGSVIGLSTASQLKAAFAGSGTLADLEGFGEGTGLVASQNMLAFVENHDTERSGASLSYQDGATNTLATQFMIAYGYGTPQVYSSFTWEASDDSPPSDADGMVTDAECTSGAWTCAHREAGVLGLVRFDAAVGDAAVENWTTVGDDVVAFSRGDDGWAAFNATDAAVTHTFTTGLARGTYCDLVTGTASGQGCSGTAVTVSADGTASVTVPAHGAVAVATAVTSGS